MIKFFRNIRQQLLGEGKTGKYLKYAIGEILLVVLGILIALQINNWNEERKQNNLQQFYLSSIIEELETNIEIFNEIIPNFQRRMESIESFFNVVNDENATEKDLQVATDSVITFIGITFFRTSVYDELNQSGDFKVFKPEIRKLISEYYNNLGNMTKLIDGSLERLNNLRYDWRSTIDIAHLEGLKESENLTVKDWVSDTESIAFMKSTNFYTERYLMMKRTETDFYEQIELTNKLIEQLRSEIN